MLSLALLFSRSLPGSEFITHTVKGSNWNNNELVPYLNLFNRPRITATMYKAYIFRCDSLQDPS